MGLGACLAVAASLPSAWTYPLRLLGVTAHELAHAAMAILTGGEVVELVVSWDESGHALTRGGVAWLVLNAGYLGALGLGRGLVALGEVVPRAALAAVALGLLAAAWWSPWSLAKAVLAVAAGASAWGVARVGRPVAGTIAQALGLFVACHAVGDAVSDFGRGDAALLAARSGVPASVWSLIWVTVGVCVLAGWARSAHRHVRMGDAP
jgi:hypothetical protein